MLNPWAPHSFDSSRNVELIIFSRLVDEDDPVLSTLHFASQGDVISVSLGIISIIKRRTWTIHTTRQEVNDRPMIYILSHRPGRKLDTSTAVVTRVTWTAFRSSGLALSFPNLESVVVFPPFSADRIMLPATKRGSSQAVALLRNALAYLTIAYPTPDSLM